MAKKAGNKAGEAFVEIGLDKNPLVRSLASVQTTFTSVLASMATQAGKFSKSLGGGLGLSGLLGGGGLAGGFALALKEGLALEEGLKLLAFAAQRTGKDGRKLREFVDGLLPSMRELTPLTLNQLRAMAALGTVYGKTGEELKKFLRQSAALAQVTGDDPVATAEKFAKALRRPGPGTLSQFGIPELAPGPGTTAKAIQERLLAFVNSLEDAARASLGLPSERLDSVKKIVKDWFAALGTAAIEAAFDFFGPKGQGKRQDTASRNVVSAKTAGGIDRALEQGLITEQQAQELREAITTGGKGKGRFFKTTPGTAMRPRFREIKESGLLDALIGVGKFVRGVVGDIGAVFGSDLVAKRKGREVARVKSADFSIGNIANRFSGGFPTASELRNQSQFTEDIADDIAAAQAETNFRMFGLTPEQVATRGGILDTPERLALSDDESASRRDLIDATRNLVDILQDFTPTGIGAGALPRPGSQIPEFFP